MHKAHDEIYGQAVSLRKTYERVVGERAELMAFRRAAHESGVVFVACGSSHWLSLSVAESARLRGLPVAVHTAGEVVMHPGTYGPAAGSPVYLAASRSGKTSETIEALRHLNRVRPGVIVAVTATPGSPLEEMADHTIVLDWAAEESVCQTRSFSTLYFALLAICALWTDDASLLAELERYPASLEKVAADVERRVSSICAGWNSDRTLTVVGSGVQFGVACEGAYIAIEMAQISAGYFRTLELRHGPIVNVNGGSLLVVVSSREARRYERAVAREAGARGAHVVAICDDGELPGAASIFTLPAVSRDETVALLAAFVTQAIAYAIALARGVDPDRPAGLVPWIELDANRR